MLSIFHRIWMLVCAGALAGCTSAAAAAAPSVYWQSSPVLANETLLIAGAGLEGTDVVVCPGNAVENCRRMGEEEVTTWAESAHVLLPQDCGQPPCSVQFSGPNGNLTVEVNKPEVWWAVRANTSEAPISSVSPELLRSVTAFQGQQIRVFGRSLGWSSGRTSCISGDALKAAPDTRLVIPNQASVVASSATCYEATFDTSHLRTGTGFNATVQTAWGRSTEFEITILAPAPPDPTPPTPVVIDVDRDCGGDVALALNKAAATVSHGVAATVQLSGHAYAVTQTLLVPNSTRLVGVKGATVLEFMLPLPSSGPRLPLPAAVTVGADVQLDGFALTIDSRTPMRADRPPYVGVWMPPNASHFRASHVDVTLSYTNVSNAFRIEGEGFELSDSRLVQNGSCGGTSDHARSFQESVTLYLHGAREGRIAHNFIGWMCSAFDLDVSERMIFESNTISCLETGTVPHGNSLSAYDWHHIHWSRAWAVARNTFSRPPCTGAPGSGGQCGGPRGLDNWVQRETLTTDGSGGWAVGYLTSSSLAGAVVVRMNWTAWTTAPSPGCRLLVIDGPGVGQSRTVIGAPANGTLVLSAPLDLHVQPGISLLAVVNDVADKLIFGNHFSWTEVVQAYALTLRYVAADNVIINGNFRHTGGGATGGILGVAGECYHGVGVAFFTEFINNSLVDSDGIALRNGGGNYFACGGYWGPWIRWSVLRRNSLAGVSLAALNATNPGGRATCASVFLHQQANRPNTTDVVAEHQRFSCPSQYVPGGTDLYGCDHCVHR